MYSYLLNAGIESGAVSRTDVFVLQYKGPYFYQMMQAKQNLMIKKKWIKFHASLQILSLFAQKNIANEHNGDEKSNNNIDDQEQNMELDVDWDEQSNQESDNQSDSHSDQSNQVNDSQSLDDWDWREESIVFEFSTSSLLAELSLISTDNNMLNMVDFDKMMVEEYNATYDEELKLYKIPYSSVKLTPMDYLAVAWNIEHNKKLLWSISNLNQNCYYSLLQCLLIRISRKIINSAISLQCMKFYDELVQRFDSDTLHEFDIFKLLFVDKESMADSINAHLHLLHMLQKMINGLQTLGIDCSNSSKLPKNMLSALKKQNAINATANLEIFWIVFSVLCSIENYNCQHDLVVHFRNQNMIKANEISKILYVLCKHEIISCKVGTRNSMLYQLRSFDDMNEQTQTMMMDAVNYMSISLRFPDWRAVNKNFNIEAYCISSKSDKNKCQEMFKKRSSELRNPNVINTALKLNTLFESIKTVAFNASGFVVNGNIDLLKFCEERNVKKNKEKNKNNKKNQNKKETNERQLPKGNINVPQQFTMIRKI